MVRGHYACLPGQKKEVNAPGKPYRKRVIPTNNATRPAWLGQKFEQMEIFLIPTFLTNNSHLGPLGWDLVRKNVSTNSATWLDWLRLFLVESHQEFRAWCDALPRPTAPLGIDWSRQFLEESHQELRAWCYATKRSRASACGSPDQQGHLGPLGWDSARSEKGSKRSWLLL